MTEKRRAPKSITFTVDEVHEALVAFLKKTRPAEYKLSKGKESVLFFKTRRGKLVMTGFEVDP